MYFLKPWVIEVQELHRPENSIIAKILDWGPTLGYYFYRFEHFDVRYAIIEVGWFLTPQYLSQKLIKFHTALCFLTADYFPTSAPSVS